MPSTIGEGAISASAASSRRNSGCSHAARSGRSIGAETGFCGLDMSNSQLQSDLINAFSMPKRFLTTNPILVKENTQPHANAIIFLKT